MSDCLFDTLDDEFCGNLIRHISNGETSVNIVKRGNDVIVDEDDFYICDINDSDLEDKIDDFENDWLETNWTRADWAYHYGCDEDELDDVMDDDMRDYD